MSVDIRAILDVDPDHYSFTCVGITPKGSRCGQSLFSNHDLAAASATLSAWSSRGSYAIPIRDLEELAELTLCPRWHRKPYYSQVRSISIEWQAKITACEARVRREDERIAMLMSERALLEMRKRMADIQMDSKEQEVKNTILKPSQMAKEQKSGFSFYVSEQAESKLEAISVESLPKPVIATPPAMADNTPSRTASTALELATSLDLAPSLPSPPTTPKRRNIIFTEPSSTKATAQHEARNAPATNVIQETTKSEIFTFTFPLTPDATPPHAMSSGLDTRSIVFEFGAGKELSTPDFGKGLTARSPSVSKTGDSSICFDEGKDLGMTPGTPASTPSEQCKLLSTSFEFSTPTKLPKCVPLLEKPSTIWDAFNAPVDHNNTSLGADPFNASVPPNDSTQHANILSKTAPIGSAKSIPAPATIAESGWQKPDLGNVSYGTALVTSSIRYSYSIQITTQQQRSSVSSRDTRERLNDIYQDPGLAFTSLSTGLPIVDKTSEKQSPELPPHQQSDGGRCMCETCRTAKSACCYSLESEAERTGCLHSSRLRRLKEAVVTKIETFKRRGTSALHRQARKW